MEQMDALRGLDQIDLSDEDSFFLALRTTLAKSQKEQEIFDGHFRHYWYVWDNAESLSYRGEQEHRPRW